MAIIDEKGRLFGRLNVIDLAGILVVLLVAAWAAYKFLVVNPRYAVTTRPYLLQVLVEEVREYTLQELKEGLVVKEGDSNQIFGKIISRQVRPARRYVETADGRVTLAEVPDKFDVILTLECEAQVSPGAVTIGGQEVRVGFNPALKGQRFLIRGTVIEMEEKK